jgi:pimeloyl-ACP methyl ester carboxylesterase
MAYLERPQARIFYEEEGPSDAACLTLLNGYSRSSSDFRALSKFMSSKGLRVLRLDNRGAGKTENADGFTVDDMVGDVLALWDFLGIASAHLLGISYGGVLSQLLANRYTSRVRSLVLVSTTSSSFFLQLDNNLSAQDPETIEKNLARYFSPKFAEKNPVLFRGMVKETAKVFTNPESRARTAQQRQALHKFDFTPLLHAIRCPTLILHGEDDQVISPEAADVANRAIRQSTLEIFPGVGHLFLAESPTLFYESVWAFLQKQP